MISAVLFDLDGTLRFNRPSGMEAFFAFCAETGLLLSAETQRAVERWIHAYWAGKHSGYAKTFPDPEAFWINYTRGMLQAAGVADAPQSYAQTITRGFSERYRPEPYVPCEAHTVLRALRDEAYTLGLVSNRAEDLAPIADEIGLAKYFHFTLSGGQAGAWKPDARIFIRACELAHAAPHDCVYVGDNYFADTLGAQMAGLIPILLDPRGAFSDADCIRIAHLAELLPAIPTVLCGDRSTMAKARQHLAVEGPTRD